MFWRVKKANECSRAVDGILSVFSSHYVPFKPTLVSDLLTFPPE